MKEVNGSYSRNISQELEIILKNYTRDEWQEDTANETPAALVTAWRRGERIPKRSGEFQIKDDDITGVYDTKKLDTLIRKCKSG